MVCTTALRLTWPQYRLYANRPTLYVKGFRIRAQDSLFMRWGKQCMAHWRWRELLCWLCWQQRSGTSTRKLRARS